LLCEWFPIATDLRFERDGSFCRTDRSQKPSLDVDVGGLSVGAAGKPRTRRLACAARRDTQDFMPKRRRLGERRASPRPSSYSYEWLANCPRLFEIGRHPTRRRFDGHPGRQPIRYLADADLGT